MDSKLKALAAEYEKARKQNIQLRNALQNEQEKNKTQSKLIDDLKSSSNSNSHGDHIALNRRVESLQSELDLRSLADSSRIKELTETVKNLEKQNQKLENNIQELQKPTVFEIGIQTDQDSKQSESDVILNLNQMIDYLNQQISDMTKNHEKDMANLIKNKKLVRGESVDLPPELKILDESDIGFVSDESGDEIKEELISAFFSSKN